MKMLAIAAAAVCLAGAAQAQTANWPTERPPQPLPARDIT